MKKSLEPVRLENTVHMAAHKGTGSTLNLVGSKVDLDSVAGRKVESRVDVKKLEKVATIVEYNPLMIGGTEDSCKVGEEGKCCWTSCL
jgi:hypothetical protein